MFDYKNNIEFVAANQFRIKGEILNIDRFGSGHINDTFCVRTDASNGKSYLLQRINHHIFPMWRA